MGQNAENNENDTPTAVREKANEDYVKTHFIERMKTLYESKPEIHKMMGFSDFVRAHQDMEKDSHRKYAKTYGELDDRDVDALSWEDLLAECDRIRQKRRRDGLVDIPSGVTFLDNDDANSQATTN